MGQKKIDIKPIHDHTEKANTYRKRKLGLLKKAYELAILCGIEIKVMISDIDQYVHYYSSTNDNDSKVQNENSVYKKILENKVIIYDNLQDAFENNPDPKKTPFIFRESTKKMRNQVHVTNLKKREIIDLPRFDNIKDLDNETIYKMISKNYLVDNEVEEPVHTSIEKFVGTKVSGYGIDNHAKKKKLICQEPIPFLLEKRLLDDRVVKIKNLEIRNYYPSIDKLAEIQNQISDFSGIISCHILKYLIDCYLNIEQKKLGTSEFKLCERLKEYSEELLINHIKNIDEVYHKTDQLIEKCQEYNQKLVEYCIIQKNSKENHFGNYLEHSGRVLIARQDEIVNENLRPYLEDFIKETFNDFIDSKTPKHLEYNNMKIEPFVDDLKRNKSHQIGIQNSFIEGKNIKDSDKKLFHEEHKVDYIRNPVYYINQGLCIPYSNKNTNWYDKKNSSYKVNDLKNEFVSTFNELKLYENLKQPEEINPNKQMHSMTEKNCNEVFNGLSKDGDLLSEILAKRVKSNNENRCNTVLLKQI